MQLTVPDPWFILQLDTLVQVSSQRPEAQFTVQADDSLQVVSEAPTPPVTVHVAPLPQEMSAAPIPTRIVASALASIVTEHASAPAHVMTQVAFAAHSHLPLQSNVPDCPPLPPAPVVAEPDEQAINELPINDHTSIRSRAMIFLRILRCRGHVIAIVVPCTTRPFPGDL
jgi:hypothetical protein